jgi:membrane-associated phospholipid phosphatase
VALKVLSGYVVVAVALASWRAVAGDGSWPVVGIYAGVLGLIAWTWRAPDGARAQRFLRDWLPLLALPLLYASIPATAVRREMVDVTVQGWDRALFGTDPARTLAGALPSAFLSEVLHAAYLSYYIVIYLPPLLMYLRGDLEAFRDTMFAFTVAMTICFAAFCVFPVAGPRYEWPAPGGVPQGPIRSLVLFILEGGSSRGTAFPSSHLAIALSVGLSSFRWSRRLGLGVLAVTLLLGLGAVYGGFHYAVDMLAGGVVGVLSVAGPGWPRSKQMAAPA